MANSSAVSMSKLGIYLMPIFLHVLLHEKFPNPHELNHLTVSMKSVKS